MRNENDDRLGQNLGISPLEEWDSGDWKEENVLFHFPSLPLVESRALAEIPFNFFFLLPSRFARLEREKNGNWGNSRWQLIRQRGSNERD